MKSLTIILSALITGGLVIGLVSLAPYAARDGISFLLNFAGIALYPDFV
jgi:hypothetical protein